MSEEIVREYNVGRFRGNFPDVEIVDGVDMESIRSRDANPMFITLPIAEIGAVSSNGLLYDEALIDSLAEQIKTNRPGGIFGHLKDEERSTSFPLPAGLWVGAKRVGRTLWAKSYIPPSAARDYVANLKDVGGEIATSIYGKGTYEKVRDGVKRLLSLKLESLDFAPPGRAALGLGAVPHVTAEMDTEQEPIMADKAQVISELTVADIPAALRDAIVAEASKQTEQGDQVAELTTQLTARDNRITVLETTVQEFQRREFARAVDVTVAELTDWQVDGAEKDSNGKTGKDKLAALRAMLKQTILQKMGATQSVDRVAEIATEAWEEIKPIAEMMRDALAGPAAIVKGRVTPMGTRPPLEDTPETRQRARADMGI